MLRRKTRSERYLAEIRRERGGKWRESKGGKRRKEEKKIEENGNRLQRTADRETALPGHSRGMRRDDPRDSTRCTYAFTTATTNGDITRVHAHTHEINHTRIHTE